MFFDLIDGKFCLPLQIQKIDQFAPELAPQSLTSLTLKTEPGGRWLRRKLVRSVPLGITTFALRTFNVLMSQDGSNAVDVSGQHGQCHIAFEAVNAVVWADIQAMHLQTIDG